MAFSIGLFCRDREQVSDPKTILSKKSDYFARKKGFRRNRAGFHAGVFVELVSPNTKTATVDEARLEEIDLN